MTPKFQNATHFKNFWEKGNGKELLDWAAIQPDFKPFNITPHSTIKSINWAITRYWKPI